MVVATFVVFGLLLLITALSIGFTLLYPWLIALAGIGVAYQFGRMIDRRTSSAIFKYSFPAILVFGVLAWVKLSYNEFLSLCNSTPLDAPHQQAKTSYAAFLVDDETLQEFEASKRISIGYQLMEQKRLAYYDEIIIAKVLEPRRIVSRRADSVANSTSKTPTRYALRSSSVERVSNHLHSPIFRVTYYLEERAPHRPLAARTEYLFGGGAVGLYMHAILGERGDYGDRDYRYLSCGYASHSPGAWRPRFSSNPNHRNYYAADVMMLSSLER